MFQKILTACYTGDDAQRHLLYYGVALWNTEHETEIVVLQRLVMLYRKSGE